MTESGSRTYAETVGRGLYGPNVGGLCGKYDHVRTYWEDQLTRFLLRPYVRGLLTAARQTGRGVRIVDLGCGAGQGFELLTRIARRDVSLDVPQQWVLPPAAVERYLGLDLSESMVEQGRATYAGHPHVAFERVDLSEGLGPAAAEAPFDLYFSSYGAMSHLDADRLRALVAAVARHGRPGAVLVLDMNARLSLEWPDYWRADRDADKTRPYTMSYLYDEAERRTGRVERFLLRFWTAPEVAELAAAASADAGVPIEVAALLDRSLLVGRHVDTNEFGTPLPPLRGRVNLLFQLNVRTDLAVLRVPGGVVPDHGPPEVVGTLRQVVFCWNQLIDFTIQRLKGIRVDLVDTAGWHAFPAALQQALMNMDRVVDSVAWFQLGDVRANVIEPQLAYLLRSLEYGLQRGLGCGHGLVAVLTLGGRR